MYAIVEDSGTQIKLCTGDVLEVDIRDLDGDSFTLDKVLMIGGEGEPTIGTPYIKGASVEVEVLEEFKDDKIDVIKFKRRKGYRRKTGHRQRLLKVRIGEISSKKKTTKKKTSKKKTTKKTTKKTDDE
jgi:large subunit ribosomal protein L21|tara:strand:- start:224 stop:607 length:384 start_codon:yes stop_codon:yes gene_type:complete